jgi:hypothetical protein
MGTLAAYVVVKYVDDLERNEPLNVGVLLGSEQGIERRFEYRGDERIDALAVQRFEELIESLVAAEEPGKQGVDGAGFLNELADRSFSHFLITKPRQVVLQNDPERTLALLSQRLVADRVTTGR